MHGLGGELYSSGVLNSTFKKLDWVGTTFKAIGKGIATVGNAIDQGLAAIGTGIVHGVENASDYLQSMFSSPDAQPALAGAGAGGGTGSVGGPSTKDTTAPYYLRHKIEQMNLPDSEKQQRLQQLDQLFASDPAAGQKLLESVLQQQLANKNAVVRDDQGNIVSGHLTTPEEQAGMKLFKTSAKSGGVAGNSQTTPAGPESPDTQKSASSADKAAPAAKGAGEKESDQAFVKRVLGEGKGASKEDVTKMQQILKKSDYGSGLGSTGASKDGVDGKFGPKTKLAAEKYLVSNISAQGANASQADVAYMQGILKEHNAKLGSFGPKHDGVDGKYGSMTKTAAEKFTSNSSTSGNTQKLIYENKVSKEFKQKVIDIAKKHKMDPNYLMAVMHFETGGSFSPSQPTPKSSAIGLIQFMPETASGLGTSSDALSKMTAVQQLDYVDKYLSQYSKKLGDNPTIEDTYMTILKPSLIGKSNNTPVFTQGTNQYTANSILDRNHDGIITKAEATYYVQHSYNTQIGKQK